MNRSNTEAGLAGWYWNIPSKEGIARSVCLCVSCMQGGQSHLVKVSTWDIPVIAPAQLRNVVRPSSKSRRTGSSMEVSIIVDHPDLHSYGPESSGANKLSVILEDLFIYTRPFLSMCLLYVQGVDCLIWSSQLVNSTLCDDDDFKVLAGDIGKPLIIKSICIQLTYYILCTWILERSCLESIYCLSSGRIGSKQSLKPPTSSISSTVAFFPTSLFLRLSLRGPGRRSWSTAYTSSFTLQTCIALHYIKLYTYICTYIHQIHMYIHTHIYYIKH